MTVHGERENIPSVDKAEAPKALKRFLDTYNEAYRELDPSLASQVETGPLGAISTADLKAQHAGSPGGNPRYSPLKLSDATFHIPKQVGWPKFFVADTDSNRDDNRWLFVFTRDGADEPWKAAYLSILSQDEVPDVATDEDGWAKPVPAAGPAPKLAARPDKLSAEYTDYLMTGKGAVFADGQSTSRLRDARKKYLRTPKFWTEYIDTPAQGDQYAPVGLRTSDGGAIVFFASHHLQKQTMAKGYRPNPDPQIKALMTGEAKKAVTLTRVAESAVRVPAKDAADPQVVFLNRLEGVTAAKGE
ncbi:hypothetical protein PS467_13015 [Streptomyces luomodiensis]|uniref:DUF8094 domain-containing protein n=1 Tax=Streptomyces luomodiensis TaxID=3026192 RepID=A0ABY9UUI0_9ACTN|nr:hypothetical protein [Streptomyces sp. SCA4-21]WNE96193.1 hypothetical protein PS467_13015 [Streptomyces sp. SCA4-21]